MSTPLRLSSFADRFPAEMRERLEKAVDNLVEKTAEELGDMADEPISTGALRASRKLVNNETKRGGLRLGWEAMSAIGIDVGRIRSKPYRRKLSSGKKTKFFTRMLGSEQAPEGFTKPARVGLRLHWEEIVAEASEEFKR